MVVVYYKKFFDFTRISFYVKLIIAVIPAVIFGLLLKKHIDEALENLYFIAAVMIGGGVIFLFVDRWFNTSPVRERTECLQRGRLPDRLFPGAVDPAAGLQPQRSDDHRRSEPGADPEGGSRILFFPRRSDDAGGIGQKLSGMSIRSIPTC